MRALVQARKLKLMAFDVDGVLTDGTLYFTAQGDEMKAFNSLDGHGLKMLAGAGVTTVPEPSSIVMLATLAAAAAGMSARAGRRRKA